MKQIVFGRLRKPNTTPIEGIFINPKPKKATGGRKKSAMARKKRRKRRKTRTKVKRIYIRSNPTKKKRRKKRRAARRPITIRVSNPKPKRRRRYSRRKRNPSVAMKRYRRKNPEHTTLEAVVKPGIAALGGFAFAGILWKLIGAGNRKKVRSWFKVNPEGKARATMAALALGGLYLMTDYFSFMKKYQKSILIGGGLRMAYETIGAFVSTDPGTTGETIRMVLGLPTATMVGSTMVGKQWPRNVPVPPGTKIEPGTGTTGKLLQASFEEDEYPYYDPYSQATAASQAALDQAMYGGAAPAQGMTGQEAVLAGFAYNQPQLNGYGYNQVVPPHLAGYAFNQPESKTFPRPF